MQLSIIIVSYNTAEILENCLDSIEKSLSKNKNLAKKTELILVDNNSQDDSPKRIKNWQKNHKNVQVILNKKNTGFAHANNQGIKMAQGSYILLLNSDTIVPSKTLETLIKTFTQNPEKETAVLSSETRNYTDKLGIVAAKLYNQDGSIQPQGGSFPTLLSLFCHMTFLDDLPLIGKVLPSTQHTGFRFNNSQSNLTQMDWVGGTAMLIKQKMIQEIGLLDEKIFMYGEDIEFCMRAKNHHWDIVINNQAPITHLGSASSTSANAIKGEIRGYLYIWSKHKPLWQIPLVYFILKSGMLLRSWFFGTILRQPKRANIYKELLAELNEEV